MTTGAARRFHERMRGSAAASRAATAPGGAAAEAGQERTRPAAGQEGTRSAADRRFQAALREALEREPKAAEGNDAAPPAARSPQARRFGTALRAALGQPAADGRGEPAPAATSAAARRFREALLSASGRPAEAPAGGTPAASVTSPLARQFGDALRRALDPANEGSLESAVTTGYSQWLMTPCPVCGHTIREGDPVWLEQRDGKTEAVHDSAELPCHSGAEPSAPKLSPPAEAFSAAFRKAYPGIRVLKVVRLRPGHPLLASKYLNGRARCRGCGHTFRPFERISICPCRPDAPEDGCRFPAHNDPAVSQLCFELLAQPGRKHCPRDFSPR